MLTHQGHKDPQEQRLKKNLKSNFQIRNKTRLCNSKTRTRELKIRKWDVQDKCENKFLLCQHMQTCTGKKHNKAMVQNHT